MVSLLTTLACSVTHNETKTATATTHGTAVYFVPHQDDDTLTFGPDMKAQLAAGHRVIVVLMTNGDMTAVCINRMANGDPSQYTDAMKAECTKERDQQFITAMKRMGVEYRIPSDRMSDSESTVSGAMKIEQRFIDHYPHAAFKANTYHELDWPNGHHDHWVMGEALRRIHYNSDHTVHITDKRFFVKPSQWVYAKRAGIGGFNSQHNINYELDAYGTGTGIGWASIPASFDEQYTSDDGIHGKKGKLGTQGRPGGPYGGGNSYVHKAGQ